MSATNGMRLSEDWRPTPDLIEYAREVGVTDPHRMAEDFCDYWLSKAGKDARKTDWSRTWKTWARREGDKCREKAAREARYARPSISYQRNLDSAHDEMRATLFGQEEETVYVGHRHH